MLVDHNTITGAGSSVGILETDDGAIFTETPHAGTAYATISGNTVSGFATGVSVQGATSTANIQDNLGSIHGNVIGIDVNAGYANVVNNHIYDNGTGIRFTNGGHGSVSGNDFTGGVANGTDLLMTSSAATDIAIGAGNKFAGSNYFIDNRTSESFDLTGYTASNFNGLDPATLSGDFRIEDRMYHKVDNISSGLITWVANNVYVTQRGTGANDETIQGGVDAAPAGFTVNVEAGVNTYNENVVINKAIILAGQNRATTIIDAARTGAAGIGIYLNGASGATIRDLTIQNAADGVDIANIEAYAYGVLVTNGSGNFLENLTINDPGLYGIFLWDNVAKQPILLKAF